MFYFNFHLFELLPSPHDAVGDISALQLVAYTANARIFFEGVVLLAGRYGTQFLNFKSKEFYPTKQYGSGVTNQQIFK
jgi:hypothetical protein